MRQPSDRIDGDVITATCRNWVEELKELVADPDDALACR